MLEFAVALAQQAGETLLAHFKPLGRAEIVDRKGQVRNLVTAADRASEDLIVAALRERFPDYGINGEERGAVAGDERHVWTIDPLDGTVNFAHGHPFFAVSIGLVVDGVPRLGVVHAPVLGETFAGEVGRGATMNGMPIRVSATDELMEAMLATGFAYVRNEHPDHNVDNFSKLIFLARSIRRAGAAALDLALVAAGRIDGFWELHLAPWDVAGGAAILLAAGGRITDFNGGDRYLECGHVVASNGLLHEAIRGQLHPLRQL